MESFIPKESSDGKLDFHALRMGYITLVFEAGANSKKAQTLARHCSAHLTENVYTRTHDERLSEITENIGNIVIPTRRYTYELTKEVTIGKGLSML